MCYKSTKDASSASSIQILHKAFAEVQWTLRSTLLAKHDCTARCQTPEG